MAHKEEESKLIYVEVEQAEDPAEPITLLETLWPGFRLDHFLFSRAGVKVRAGSSHINKAVAEQSILYFTFVRRNRPTSDLSHGWGHTSQWKTLFWRNYEDELAWYYNVDGIYDLTDPGRAISAIEQEDSAQYLNFDARIERLVNRCCLRTQGL